MIPLTQVCVSEVVWIVYLISTPQVDLELAKDKSPPPAPSPPSTSEHIPTTAPIAPAPIAPAPVAPAPVAPAPVAPAPVAPAPVAPAPASAPAPAPVTAPAPALGLTSAASSAPPPTPVLAPLSVPEPIPTILLDTSQPPATQDDSEKTSGSGGKAPSLLVASLEIPASPSTSASDLAGDLQNTQTTSKKRKAKKTSKKAPAPKKPKKITGR